VVISKNVDVGQTVAASFQTPTLFLVAQDLTQMQIDTNVSEADIGKVKEGQNVEYTIDGYPDITFKGKVQQVRNSPLTVQNVVTYDVVIYVDNNDLKLKPGMTANVSIITSEKNNTLLVPNASLRFIPEENKKTYKNPGIWVLKEGNKLRRIDIETGISNGNYTEIKSGNIKAGQNIVVESLSKDKGGSDTSYARRSGRLFRMGPH
jgi:HlyD family secretion protein